jgi:hypothetical protein
MPGLRDPPQDFSAVAWKFGHDFSNVLAAISLAGELLLDTVATESERAIVREILVGCGRGDALTKRLLVSSRR